MSCKTVPAQTRCAMFLSTINIRKDTTRRRGMDAVAPAGRYTFGDMNVPPTKPADIPMQQSPTHRLFESIAASTFGGDIGSSVNRLPVARSIALAMAASGGQILTSAAPLAPYGWLGFGTSIITRLLLGQSEAY